nr:MAG TPA_asm: hypothetical protein [Caudoviricetes sp.]
MFIHFFTRILHRATSFKKLKIFTILKIAQIPFFVNILHKI